MDDSPQISYEVATPDQGEPALVATKTYTETETISKQDLLDQKGSLESALTQVNERLSYFPDDSPTGAQELTKQPLSV